MAIKKKKTYDIEGLECESCALKIEEKIKTLPEVNEAYINLINENLTVKEKGDKEISDSKIAEIFDKIEPGSKIYKKESKNTYKYNFVLKNISCASCIEKIERNIEGMSDVIDVTLNFNTGKLVVRSNKEIREKLVKKIKSVEPEIIIDDQDENQNYSKDINENEDGKTIIKNRFKLIVGSVLYVIAIILFEFQLFEVGFINSIELWKWLIYGSSYLLVGEKVLLSAYRNIKRGQIFDENFLMVVATLGAFGIREFPEAVAVMLFYKIGDTIQQRAVKSSRKSIKDLMDIKPEYANIKIGGEVKQISPEGVEVGDSIIVKPGEKIPLDGIVLEGESMVDNSALTGESVLKKIEPGVEVLNGSINKSGVLLIRVTTEYSESTVSKILHLIEEATAKKAPAEKFITKFARYYTPVVVATASLIAVIPPVFFGGLFNEWLYRALVFLVVSCPCALVISIPLGFFGGIGKSSQQGILVKGSNYLDALNNVNHIVFDKTGTLTEGNFKVDKIHSVNGFLESEILKNAAYVESNSVHPIANSIIEHYGKEIDNDKIKNYEEKSGKGVQATIEGKNVVAGNKKMMSLNNIEVENVAEDGTIIYISIEDKYAGYIKIADRIKKSAKNAVKKLKDSGIKNISLLTGDQENIAKTVSNKLNIDNYYSELLPHEKVKKVEEILEKQNPKDKLIFVGDGINDAPVLARSDIGVAMGGLGSDAAIEAADIVLMTDEPSKLSEALQIAKKTRKIVWQNIGLALGVKGIVLLFGVLGMATMWEAVFADVGVAILAVLNSARIIKK
ncbi:MAG: cadmium-translocating P-type ATPase [Halanaerobiales bacterium]|nr:cadmium-translocating P-type ATPase [Halanaerobiales bacterium]